MTIEFLEHKKLESFSDTVISELRKVPVGHMPKDELTTFQRILNDIDLGRYKLSTHELFYLSRAKKSIWPKYLGFREKFNRLASDKIDTDFPLYLLIEPTSICNLRCVMCFQIDKSFGEKKEYMGKMDINLFKRLIDEAHEGGTQAITLASRGDPSIHRQLPEMLAYMKGKFLEVKLNTNGILLTEELSRAILSSEVTDLVFSIDSYEKENYEEIRRKGKFDQVLANIKNFMSIREREFPKHRTAVRVSGVKVDNKQDKNAYNEFWTALVDYAVLVNLQERWDTYNNDVLDPDVLLPCGDLWERMYIWWDGTVNPCDVDYKSTLAVGNVNEHSIRELWHGEKYRNLRAKHLSGNRSQFLVCAKCDAWTKGPVHHSALPLQILKK